MSRARHCAGLVLAVGILTTVHGGKTPLPDVPGTTWSLVGRLRHAGTSSPDLTHCRVTLAADGSFLYEIEDDVGETVTYTGFWIQKKTVTLTFDEESRRRFEELMTLNFLNVGFRVDLDIKKWRIKCTVKSRPCGEESPRGACAEVQLQLQEPIRVPRHRRRRALLELHLHHSRHGRSGLSAEGSEHSKPLAAASTRRTRERASSPAGGREPVGQSQAL